MEPFDLLQWRHANKMTKTALAKALGMHRNTVERWESGEARMPVGLRARLDMLATAKQAASMPELVTPNTAKHRPDLKLYTSILTSTHGRATYRDAEHPGRLLPHLAPPDGKPYPWNMLESDEYKTALAMHRSAQIHKRANATPAALTALMERGIAE